MKWVIVAFMYVGTNPDIPSDFYRVKYRVQSNNLPMGIAKAQYMLAKDMRSMRSGLLVGEKRIFLSRYNYKVVGAKFAPDESAK